MPPMLLFTDVRSMSMSRAGSNQLSSPKRINLATPKISANSALQTVLSHFSTLVSAYSVGSKVSRLLKAERRALGVKEDLIRELSAWSASLEDPESKRLVLEYVQALSVDIEVREDLMQRHESVYAKLQDVFKREKKSHDLREERDRSCQRMKAEEPKGQSQKLTFYRESFEELECTLDIVEDQFIRSIRKEFGETVQHLVQSMGTGGLKYAQCALTMLGGRASIEDLRRIALPAPRGSHPLDSRSPTAQRLLSETVEAPPPLPSFAKLYPQQPSRPSTGRTQVIHEGHRGYGNLVSKKVRGRPSTGQENHGEVVKAVEAVPTLEEREAEEKPQRQISLRIPTSLDMNREWT